MNEDAVSFTIRTFEIREKILLASNEEGEVPYAKPQVEKLCLSTIESGINKDISLIVRPLLISQKATDVDIMNEVRKAEASLQLRQQKEVKKAEKIAVMSSENTQSCQAKSAEESQILKALKSMESKLSSVDELKREMKQMKGDLDALKLEERMLSKHEIMPGNYTCREEGETEKYPAHVLTNNDSVEQGDSGRCMTCVKKKIYDCQHCFNCGSGSHWYRECRRNPGNGNGRSSKGK